MRKQTRTRVSVVVVGAAVVAGLAYAYVDARPPGSGGVTGRYFGEDDTGLGSHPADGGTLLVIPGVTVHDVWPEHADPDEGPVFDDFSPTLQLDELAEDFDAELVEVQSNGRFRINAPSGPAVVCLLDEALIGCVEIDLPESGSLRASRGEGGFYIE